MAASFHFFLSANCKIMGQENLEKLEEANKYEHRELNKKQELFYYDPMSAGSCFWCSNLQQITRILEEWVLEKRLRGDLEPR